MTNRAINFLFIFLAVSAATFLVFYFSLLDIWQEKLFDTFFTKKTAPSTIVIFAVDNESIAKIGQWPWSRSIFAGALNKLSGATVVAIDINFSEVSKTDAAGDALLALAIAHAKPNVILPVQVDPKTREVVEPLPIFRQKSLLGQVNIATEDGVVRNIKNPETGFVNFGALAALQYQENLPIPEAMRIDYAGPQKTFITLPISDLLENKVPESVYKNKMVFIGATAPDLHDYFQTPFGPLAGVEIHANIAATALGQKFYKDLPAYASLLFILLCNLTTAFFILKIKKFHWLVASLLAALVVINIFGLVLFSWYIIFPILYINIGFIITSAALIIFQYLTESKEKKFIYDSFKYYLAPDIIKEIIKDPKKLAVGGERKTVTLFLSDIRGFTTMAEGLAPEQLGHILGEYFTRMGDIIMGKKGLVVEYVGDAIMAFWGAPLPNASHAKDACLSALHIIEELKNLNQHWKDTGIPVAINIGIGLNTGEVVVGNFGSKKRLRYTALGDQVNLTSRIERLNKVYGTQIIITESTKKEIENYLEFHTRELDTIIVKGKKEPKIIFELMATPLPKNILEYFNLGREYYKEGDWAKAIENFALAAGHDPASQMYLERCQDLQKNPPQNWQGIYEFQTK